MNKQDKKNLPSKNITLPSVWQTSSQGLENTNKARSTVTMKHGMFASVPIICKGRACPYFSTCWIPETDLQVGERCPIEIGAILERFDAYCEKLNIDPEDDIVDGGLVKEIVDIEIMMLRADSLLATSGKMIEDVVAGISPKGQEYYKPEIHPAVGLKESLREKKIKLYNQLNATRKDRKDEGMASQDPSSVAARIIQKVKELEKKGTIIDITPEDESKTREDE